MPCDEVINPPRRHGHHPVGAQAGRVGGHDGCSHPQVRSTGDDDVTKQQDNRQASARSHLTSHEAWRSWGPSDRDAWAQYASLSEASRVVARQQSWDTPEAKPGTRPAAREAVEASDGPGAVTRSNPCSVQGCPPAGLHLRASQSRRSLPARHDRCLGEADGSAARPGCLRPARCKPLLGAPSDGVNGRSERKRWALDSAAPVGGRS
jgi:hypothetical protein